MKNLTLVFITIIGATILGCKTKSKQKIKKSKIVCDIFKVNANRKDNEVSISINTDLPNDTKIRLTATRSYNVKGSSDDDTLSYFSKIIVTGKWKKPYNLSLNNKKWKDKLQKRQKKLLKKGIANDISSISYSVIINAKVLPNQFGKHNTNLTGKAVNGNKIHNINHKNKIYYPIHYFANSKSKAEASTNETNSGKYVRIIANHTYIHQSPNNNSTVIAKANKDNIFELSEVKNRWYGIYMFSGEQRYIRKSATKLTNALPSLPYSTSTLKKICYELVRAQDKSQKKADRKYTSSEYIKNIDYQRLLDDRYEMRIFEKYDLPPAKNSKLIAKCAENHWIPPLQ